MDRRLGRSELEPLDQFDRLQALHEAAVDCLTAGRLEELTPGMRALTVLFAVAGEVDNGGFAACMYNSTGDWAGEAVTAARLIGAEDHAAVIERFIEIGLDGDADMPWDARNQRLEAMTDDEAARLESLDEEFYALPSIDEPLTAYVDDHPGEFIRD